MEQPTAVAGGSHSVQPAFQDRAPAFAAVAALTALVVFARAVGVRAVDQAAATSRVRAFGDPLWWSAAMVTTISNEKHVVTPRARAVAILERLDAVSVLGDAAASIANCFVGSQPASDDHMELSTLRDELAALRVELRLAKAQTRAASPNSAR